MILFAILAIMLLILVITAVITIAVGGSAMILIFGDLIVCAVLIALIMKAIIRKKR